MKFSKTLLVLAAILASSAFIANGAIEKNWLKTYTAWPQPTDPKPWIKDLKNTVMRCNTPFSLCSYASCTWIPDSVPPMAQCGCYEFNGPSIGGATVGILNKEYQQKTKKYCSNPKKNCAKKVNSAPFCKGMLDGKMYPNYDTVSTYNTTDWAITTGQSNSGANQKCTEGGIFTLCYTAACRRGKPSNPLLDAPAGQPQYNSTCFCPVYKVGSDSTFFVTNNATDACGPKKWSQLTRKTILYNGL